MATLAVVIQLDNAIFEEEPEAELERIFRDLATAFYPNVWDYKGGSILDVNGNTIGHVTIAS